MVSALLNSLLSLFWLVLLLFLVLFVFAVGFMQAIQQSLQAEENPKTAYSYDHYMQYYGSVPKAMVSLLETITGSTGWYPIMGPVMEINYAYAAATIFFVSFTM